MLTVPDMAFETARSGKPSPLKSPAITDWGLESTAKLAAATKLGRLRFSSASMDGRLKGDLEWRTFPPVDLQSDMGKCLQTVEQTRTVRTVCAEIGND